MEVVPLLLITRTDFESCHSYAMTDGFSDTPISTVQDDRYGVAPFAKALSQSILAVSSPVGTTIALNGPWGSGKSSVVNLVRLFLEQEPHSQLSISEFKCWWFRGEEALALAFLQNLYSSIRESLPKQTANLLPKIGRSLLEAGPVIGSAIALSPAAPLAGLFSASASFAAKFFPKTDPLESLFHKLSAALEQQKKRHLIIIDDIDRLSPEEALAIFRLVKSIGRLPNVMYLLAFDRILAEKAVGAKYPSEGPQYLEKIVQTSFEIPMPISADIQSATLSTISEICGEVEEGAQVRLMNIYYDIIALYVSTPRDVTRFKNAIAVTWPAIAQQINLADFLALEAFRVYEPSVYHAIRKNRTSLIGAGSRLNDEGDRETLLSSLTSEVPVDRRSSVKDGLQRLFPALESTSYGSEFNADWDFDRRVCIEAHFETAFRLSLSEETLSSEQIDQLLDNANDRSLVRQTFLDAAGKRRRNNESLVPVLLDAATVNAKRFDEDKLVPFTTELFAIHDEIDLERDEERGMMAVASTTNRLRWFINKAINARYDLDERSRIYEAALREASLGWLVRFTASARRESGLDGGKSVPEKDRLVRPELVVQLTELALEKIRAAAQDGALLNHRGLLSILFRWKEFNDGNTVETKTWIEEQSNSAQGLVALAKAFTGEAWVHGGGVSSLSDRVSRRHIRSSLRDDIDLLDSAKFIDRLKEALRRGDFEGDNLVAVETFLKAHNNRDSDW